MRNNDYVQTRRELVEAAMCGWPACQLLATEEMLDPVDRLGQTWMAICPRHGGRKISPLMCEGRAVDDESLSSIGEPCGRKFSGVGWGGPTVEEQLEQARAKGWSVAGPPMCPRCRQADPAISRGLTVLEGAAQLLL